MKSYIIRVIAGIFALMFMLINFSRDDIFADEWSEPVKFYNTYGNSAVFKPTGISDGEIYFCSAGNISTSGTKYRTIGYKLSVKNTSGNVIQSVYYQMPGKYMKLKYQAKSNGKEYLMYSISLNVMRKRLSTQSLNALTTAQGRQAR